MVRAVPGVWSMPGRTVDDRVPGDANNVGDVDLLADMPQPVPLFSPG